MNVDGQNYRTIWLSSDGATVQVIDQRRLPHEFITTELRTVDDAVDAICEHDRTRGAAHRRDCRLWSGARAARGSFR